jgi:hypothetical protein
MSAAVRPDPKTATVEEIAEHYAANHAELVEVDQWLYFAKRRLREGLRDRGIVDTLNGRLTLSTDKWQWDKPALIEEFPEVGAHQVVVATGNAQKSEQVISYLLESGFGPDDVDHEIRPDLRLVNRVIKLSPEKAKRLLDLRVPDGKIELLP